MFKRVLALAVLLTFANCVTGADKKKNMDFVDADNQIKIVADTYTPSPRQLLWVIENYPFEEFMAKHPNVKIVPFTALNIPGAAQKSAKLMAVAGETPPDLWRMFFHETLKYANQGFLIPLNKYIGEDLNGDGFIDETEAKEPFWNDISRETKMACTKDGKIYAVPQATSIIQANNYRRDLFAAAGLNPDEPPLNWDDFWRYAQKLTFKPNEVPGKEKGQYGIYFAAPGHLCFNPMVWAAGGELVMKYKINPKTGKSVEGTMYQVIDKDPETGDDLKNVPERWKAAFNTQAGLDALKFIYKLRWQRWAKDPETKEPFDLTPEMLASGEAVSPAGRKFKLTNEGSTGNIYVGVTYTASAGSGADASEDRDINKIFAEGRIGMFFSYNDASKNVITSFGLVPEQFGIGPMPVMKGKPIVGSYMPQMFGISLKRVRTPEAEKLTWELLKYLTSKEVLIEKTRLAVEGGQGLLVFPPHLKLAGYDELYNSLPSAWKNIETIVQKNQTEPFNSGWTEVQAEVTPGIVQKIWKYEDCNLKALLDDAEKEANRRFEPWTESELAKWRPYVWIFAVLSLFGFLYATWITLKSIAPQKARAQDFGFDKFNKKSMFNSYMLYLWLVPAVACVGLWGYYPMIKGSFMAFQDYKLIGNSPWVGVDNFVMLFGNPDFYASMGRTLYWVALNLGIGFFTPIFVAILLTEVPVGKVFFRTIWYLPSLTSGLVILFLWKMFYDPSPTGFLNTILIPIAHLFGNYDFQGWGYLSDPAMAMVCVILPGVWAGAGVGSLIYQAALVSVPHDLYEAADVDGAGFCSKIWNITIPTLKPLVLMGLLGSFIGTFHGMGSIFVMTGGGPFNATRVIGLDIFLNSFLYLKFGTATAMAWVLGSLLIGFTILQLKLLSKVEFRKAEEN